MAWLSRLPPRDRLAMVYAIADLFPRFKKVSEWRAAIDGGLVELKPTRQEHEDIIIEGSRISRILKRQLKSDEPDR
jgi:hypothetical protein